MFSSASSFNQPVEAWNVGRVISMNVRRRPASYGHRAPAHTQLLKGSGLKSRVRVLAWCRRCSMARAPSTSLWLHGTSAWSPTCGCAAALRQCCRVFTHSCARGRGHILCACAGAAQYMFRDASSFDQCLAAWNVGRVTNMAVRRPPVCRARAHIAAQGRAATSHVRVLARRRVCSTSRVQHIL